ncbi:MAG: hypothetical protein RIT45_1720 [Pseudomonadota bacterium]|jgi:tetratricopeptide (TPR) repeat protein
MRPLRAIFAVLLAAAMLLPSAPRVAVAAPDPAAIAAAEAKATEAKAFFKAGLFPRAAERFMEAYALSKRPALVYNAARAYEEGQLRAEAIALFKLYEGLKDASGEGRKEARERRERLESELAKIAGKDKPVGDADKPTPTPTPTPTPDSTPPWRTPTVIGGLALGAAAAIGGGVLLGLAASDQSTLDADLDRRDASGKIVGVDYDTYRDRQIAIDDRRRLGGISLGVGGALLAGSAVLWFFTREPATETVTWVPSADGFGRVEWAWRF